MARTVRCRWLSRCQSALGLIEMQWKLRLQQLIFLSSLHSCMWGLSALSYLQRGTLTCNVCPVRWTCVSSGSSVSATLLGSTRYHARIHGVGAGGLLTCGHKFGFRHQISHTNFAPLSGETRPVVRLPKFRRLFLLLRGKDGHDHATGLQNQQG